MANLRTFLSHILIFGFVIILASACATAKASDSGPAKDSPRIIAIGDIHGDFEAYDALLSEAGLADEAGKWTGGKTILVQTGDIPDRGPDTLKIITHIRSLQKQAKRKGGAVITLIGNHEAMNMTEDLRYVHPGEFAAFTSKRSEKMRERLFELNKAGLASYYRKTNPQLSDSDIKAAWFETMPLGKIEHQQAWLPKGAVGKWVVRNPGVALIDGNHFAHGGGSALDADRSVKEINKDISKAMKARESEPTSIINDPLGPLWYRGYSEGGQSPSLAQPDLTSSEELDQVLERYGARRMIVGHTPQRSGIKVSHDGKFFQIDTGMSKHYGGTRSFLRIEKGQVFAHDSGTITPL